MISLRNKCHGGIESHQRNLEPCSEPKTRFGVKTPSEVALDLLLFLLSSRVRKASNAGLLRSFRHAPAATVNRSVRRSCYGRQDSLRRRGKHSGKLHPVTCFILLCTSSSSLPSPSSLPRITNIIYVFPFVPCIHAG